MSSEQLDWQNHTVHNQSTGRGKTFGSHPEGCILSKWYPNLPRPEHSSGAYEVKDNIYCLTKFIEYRKEEAFQTVDGLRTLEGLCIFCFSFSTQTHVGRLSFHICWNVDMKILYHSKHVAKHLFPNSLFCFFLLDLWNYSFFSWLLFLNTVSYFRCCEKSACPGLQPGLFRDAPDLRCFFSFPTCWPQNPTSQRDGVQYEPLSLGFWRCTGWVLPPQKTRLRCTITALILCPEISEVLLYCKSSCVYLFVSRSDSEFTVIAFGWMCTTILQFTMVYTTSKKKVNKLPSYLLYDHISFIYF